MSALFVASIVACKEKNPAGPGEGHGIVLDSHELTLYHAQTVSISIKDADKADNYFWSCSNSDVLLLSNNVGTEIVIEALEDGEAEIRATKAGDLDVYDVCKVKVSTKQITSFTFAGVTKYDRKEEYVGGYYYDNLEIEPEDASNKKYSIKISNPSILEAEWNEEQQGYKITPMAEGEAKVTYTTTDGSDRKVQINVRVLKNRTEPTALRLTANNKMVVGATQVVQPEWTPADAGKCDYTVSSSDEEVAKVYHTGFGGVFTIHAKKAGTATITVESVTYHGSGHLKENIYLTVYEDTGHSLKFDLSGLNDFIETEKGVDNLVLFAGNNLTLPVIRGNGIDEVVWSSSNTGNVKFFQSYNDHAILQTGSNNLTSQSGRNAVITATLKDHPEVSASIGVECYNQASALKLVVYEGDSYYHDVLKYGLQINNNLSYYIRVVYTNSGRFRYNFDLEMSPEIKDLISCKSDYVSLTNPTHFVLRRVSKEALPEPVSGTIRIRERGFDQPYAEVKVTVK